MTFTTDHWNGGSDFNKEIGESDLFAENVSKIKQEASGWPDWVKTDEDKLKHIADYAANERIEFEKQKI